MDLGRHGIVEGAAFAGDFRVGEVLSERTARVLRLRDRAAGVLTALELPPEVEARFLRPPRAGGHEGVLWPWARGGLGPGVGWCITPEVSAPTLDDLLDEGPFPVSRAIPLLRALIEALRAVHETGEVLANLRPASILVVPGWNRDRIRIPCASWLVGPPAGFRLGGYCAPEVAWDELAPACDQYTLGVIAYELLMGTPPHNPEAPPGERTQIALQVGGPPGLTDLVRTLLADDPRARFESLEALDRELAGVSGGLPDDEVSTYGSFTPIIPQRRGESETPAVAVAHPSRAGAPDPLADEPVVAPATDTALGFVVVALSVGTAALGLSYAVWMMW